MSVTCKPQSCKTTPSSIQTCTRLQFHSYWLLFMYFSTSSLRGYFLLSVSFPRFLFQIFLEHSFRFCILMILWAILVLFRYLLLNAVLNPTLPAFNCVLLFNKIEIKKSVFLRWSLIWYFYDMFALRAIIATTQITFYMRNKLIVHSDIINCALI